MVEHHVSKHKSDRILLVFKTTLGGRGAGGDGHPSPPSAILKHSGYLKKGRYGRRLTFCLFIFLFIEFIGEKTYFLETEPLGTWTLEKRMQLRCMSVHSLIHSFPSACYMPDTALDDQERRRNIPAFTVLRPKMGRQK